MAQALSNLPIGAKIKFGKHRVNTETPWDIIWLVVAKNHAGYPTNSVTLLAEKCLNTLSYDVREPNNSNADRKSDGNNRYSISNIDQWLDSSNAEWYVSRHSADTPPSVEYVPASFTTSAYLNKNGFQYLFTNVERNAILHTTIRNMLNSIDGNGYDDVTRKVFLPSMTEVRNYTEGGLAEGSQWEWFITNPNYKCQIFEQARVNISNSIIPTSSSGTIPWWTRTPSLGLAGRARYYDSNGEYNTLPVQQVFGIRPALNLSSSLKISDTTDSDGCYTAIWNTAPSAPSILNVPTISGGKSNAISWSNVSDPDGDAVTYTLECSVNGGAYSVLYTGTSTAYAHLVPFGTTSVQYRVKATDPSNASSAYTTSTSRTVINNNAPVISGSDSNLGVKSEGFTGTYTVTDANNNTVTVTESIDGVQIRSLVVTLGATNTYGITGNTWLALPNGSHTFTIRATDGIDSSVRTYTFTKLVNSFTIRNSTPWSSSTMPSRIMLVVTRNLPSGATFKVEVCNNGFDSTPVWEDATDAVRSGLVHVFSNKVKTSSQWGVLIKVTVNRNGATGACYVSAIGGNFE